MCCVEIATRNYSHITMHGPVLWRLCRFFFLPLLRLRLHIDVGKFACYGILGHLRMKRFFGGVVALLFVRTFKHRNSGILKFFISCRKWLFINYKYYIIISLRALEGGFLVVAIFYIHRDWWAALCWCLHFYIAEEVLVLISWISSSPS